MDRNEFIKELKKAAKIINTGLDDDETLDYLAEEVTDRLTVYLNCPEDDLDKRLVRIAARILPSIYNQTKANVESTDVEQGIKSISDNGQTVTFTDRAKSYMASESDDQIFGGFAELLAPYRRPNVIR